MAKFRRTATVICSIKITSAGTLTSPANSTNIIIYDPVGAEAVSSTAMDVTSTGLFYYDYTPASTALRGRYEVQYKLTDGTRITIGATGLDGCSGIYEFELE